MIIHSYICSNGLSTSESVAIVLIKSVTIKWYVIVLFTIYKNGSTDSIMVIGMKNGIDCLSSNFVWGLFNSKAFEKNHSISSPSALGKIVG